MGGLGKAPAALTLLESEVHLWQSNLDVSPIALERFARTLSPDEQERAERFRFPRDRRRFTVGRGILRDILGRYLSVPPAALQFCYGMNGKPALVSDAACGLEFNLSHSEALMVCAIARHYLIGIDVEAVRSIARLDDLTQRFFSPQEHATIHALSGEPQLRSFFQHWTCKEALVKAVGEGLMSLSTIELDIAETAMLLQWEQPRSTLDWSLQLLTPAPGYIAAVAVNTTAPSFTILQWQDNEGLAEE